MPPAKINLLYMRCIVLRSSSFILFFFYLIPASFSQLGKITFDIQKDKPKKFQNKVLKSETTGDKKFTLKKRIVQNTVTHYNYYFNANNKLNAVIERARIANKDNYSKLLPFYGYSLNATAAQKTELDSVIYKATAGILLHDLRNNWVDNLYLLIGKSYYLQKEFDSAGYTFQFINYTLFPHKKKDDNQLIVGTNTNANGTISIANKEDRNIVDKAFSLPPSRNDALIWQVRTLIETKDYPEAAGLINTLQNDQNFPVRLKPDLEEADAYWFYKNGVYDSAANHLEKALSAADDKQDKARWEYLLAQLFQTSHQYEKASEYYSKAIKHTTDPLLDIYANLSNAKMYKSNDPKEVDNSIANLMRMAKRDKFETYRDIVYYSAGELALEKNDTAAAQFYFKKSISYNIGGTEYKTKSYLQLADIAYSKKNYKAAYTFYDSLKTDDDVLVERRTQVEERKKALVKIVEKINIIEREDSLQNIAMMSAADREIFIKKVLRQLRKEKGLKDEDQTKFNSASVFNNTNQSQSIDLFSAGNSNNGDWYFYNTSVKANGYNDFRSRWGQRLNVDNWRRKSAADAAVSNFASSNLVVQSDVLNNNTASVSGSDLSYDGLLKNIPTTAEKINLSNTLISNSLFELGKLYQNNLEDYAIAVQTYETSLQRFPDSLYHGELYLNLVYCYQKLGDIAKASFYKNLLVGKFNGSKYAQFVTNPQALKTGEKNPAATKRYEDIYNLFIEGEFEKAVNEKKAADSLYENNYWSPQLLYIESVYYIKQKKDSEAVNVLNQIVNQYPTSLLKDKAVTMIDVLKRRSQIENYLTKLDVTRVKDDSVIVTNDKPVQQQIVAKPDTLKNIAKPTTVQNKPVLVQPKVDAPKPITNGSFSFVAQDSQNVVMILSKVDPVYISEARNAFSRYNRENFSSQAIDIKKDSIDKERNILIFSQFADADAAMIYEERLKRNASTEVSWLPANKYSFLIISNSNLQVLKTNKDVAGYIKLLNTRYPGKF